MPQYIDTHSNLKYNEHGGETDARTDYKQRPNPRPH